MKKELNRIDVLYNKMQKDFKETRIQFGLMVDEISELRTHNKNYREIIAVNEKKAEVVNGEILDLQ